MKKAKKKAKKRNIEVEDVTIKEITKMQEIVTDHTPNQIKCVKNWDGASRWSYNKAIDIIKGNDPLKKSKKYLRQFIVVRKSECVKKNKWLLETPSEIRDAAVLEAYDAFVENVSRVKADTIRYFNMKFRKKKKPTSMYLKKRCYGCRTPYPMFWKHANCEPLVSRKQNKLPDTISADSKIMIRKPNILSIIIPICTNRRVSDMMENECMENESQVSYVRTIALDPGVRTFMVGYDPNGYVFEVGHYDIYNIILKHCVYLDHMIGKSQKCKCKKTKYNLRSKVIPRIRNLIKNKIRDFHCRFAKWLCCNYDLILLPPFDSTKLVNRATRNINNKTARAMMNWSHCRFRDLLIFKSRQVGMTVKLITEEYTTRTCGCCGYVNLKTSSPKFRCVHCGISLPRDWNGARNIYIKSCTEHVALMQLCGLAPPERI